MRLPQDRILHIDTEFVDGKVNIVAKWQGELVRCKDCIHWYEPEETCLKIYSDGAASAYAWQFRKPDDFCSYGERRTNDSNT